MGKKYGEKWPAITWHVLQFTCSRLFALGMTIFCFWLNCNSRNWLCSDQIRRAGDFFFSWLICFSILDSDSVFLFQIKKFRANWPTSVHFIKWLCLSFWKWNAKINSWQRTAMWSWMKCTNYDGNKRYFHNAHNAYCSLNVISSEHHHW